MQIGLIGLPLSGKSTVFQALTGVRAAPASYGRRDEPHVAVVRVPDDRLERLVPLFNPQRTVHASVEFVDLGALRTPGAEPGEGFSPSFLAATRNVDALALVVGAYLPDSDPKRDLEELELELELADLQVIERRLERLEAELRRTAAGQRAELESERSLLERLRAALEGGTPIRDVGLDADETKALRGYAFLTAKPAFYILNVAEDAIHSDEPPDLSLPGVRISGEIEAEIAELEPEEAGAFLADLGLDEPGIHRVIRLAYAACDLISFFTVGPDEVRAWTIREGTTAVEAAGVVHSDLARGFIRAEVVSYEDLLEAGSLAEARRRGTLRLEGKGYVVKDAEICHFLSNV